MAGFLTGDTLGNIKSLIFVPSSSSSPTCEVQTIFDGTTLGKGKGIQLIAREGSHLTAALRSDGTAGIYTTEADGSLGLLHEWKEARFRKGSTFVGLSLTDGNIYTCTSNGALRRIVPPSNDHEVPTSDLATLPMRLKDWKLSPDGQTFAYGGDEVELSLWDLERAFTFPPPATGSITSTSEVNGTKKRKRVDELLPAEIWRAKNVPNDELALRVPVHNTSLVFLSSTHGDEKAKSSVHLLAGTHHGAVRRYDTRAARKPVANWKEIVKTGPVRAVQVGCRDHEAFVSDHNSNLLAIDLRNGRILYSYKGISATPTAHTLPLQYAPHLLASTSNDRYVRLHSTYAPPEVAGVRQHEKGEVLAKVYVGAMPTCVVWDGLERAWNVGVTKECDGESGEEGSGSGEEEEDVWAGMDDVGEEEDEQSSRKRRK